MPLFFFGYHCSLISSQNTSSTSVEGGASGKQGVVISMDPFLYDSWHSLPLGKGQISGGRRWFPLFPLPPWGGLSVNYIRLGLCTTNSIAGCSSSPTIPLPPHHQLYPDRYSHLAWSTKGRYHHKCVGKKTHLWCVACFLVHLCYIY